MQGSGKRRGGITTGTCERKARGSVVADDEEAIAHLLTKSDKNRYCTWWRYSQATLSGFRPKRQRTSMNEYPNH